MKDDTKSFYRTAVARAVVHIVENLDEALDLSALAHAAALSPFHFHRVFRGMVGETPLELHRRLRMERAAARLVAGATSVTAVAFEAGYDTHEAFTRAFRALYGVPPSAFRRPPAVMTQGCERPRPTTLAARNGLHFHPAPASAGRCSAPADFMNSFRALQGGSPMNVDVRSLSDLRLATVRHVGAYHTISEAFARLGQIAGAAGLLRRPDAKMLAVYHDDPETTPTDQLTSDAGITVPDGVPLPEGLAELRLRGGRYAVTTHRGSYSTLGDTWGRFMGEWLPQSGHRVGPGLSFEIYLNTPMQGQEDDLITELYLSLA